MSKSKAGLFFKLLGKNIGKSLSFQPQRYTAGDIQVFCVHCKHPAFIHERKLLNTAGMTFLKLDFANKEADVLICDRCGYIHWFGKPVKRLLD